MPPWKRLDLRLRIARLGKLFPNHVGIVSDRLFSPKSMAPNLVQFFKFTSISPTNLFLFNFKDRILFREPMEGGTLPDNLLFVKIRVSNDLKCDQQSGSSSDNSLLEISRNFKGMSLVILQMRFSFENLFWNRFDVRTRKTKDGIGPSNWFELRSISEVCWQGTEILFPIPPLIRL